MKFFETSEKHEQFRQEIRAFAEQKIRPYTFQWDRESIFPKEIVKEMAARGWMGIPYPKEYGGAGLDVISYAIAVEELARVDSGVGVILSAHVSLGTWPIFEFGTEKQREKYLVPLARGEKLGAFGLTEVNAGSDAGGTETKAVLNGDHYVLNGEKIFITNGEEADTYIIFAVTTPGIGTKGISAFIVEKGWEGFTFGDHYDKMGIRSSITAQLKFKDVKVPKENLLGQEGQGFKIAMATLDGGRIGIASQALGIAQGAFESAFNYAKERVQFGKPLTAQQIISFKLADMATSIKASRMLVYSAADMKENHIPYGMDAAMAKQYASDTAVKVTEEAVQIFGGNGYLRGMDVERMYRDAKITKIYEGTNEIMRVVIAAHLIGKDKAKQAAAAAAAAAPAAAVKPAAPKPQGNASGRKGMIFKDDSAEDKVKALLKELKADGFVFTAADNAGVPIREAKYVVSVGMGIGAKDNMKLIEDLAHVTGAAIGSSRPVAEARRYVTVDRFVGMSGQKFTGDLYIACGISGALQHLKGIEKAGCVVAINTDESAAIFRNCDYGIVGDIKEIIPILIEEISKNS